MADPQNKVAIKMDDERFLRSKPELRWLVESFVEATLLEKPTDVEAFAREFFTKPERQTEWARLQADQAS